jgi:hypothetical protein
VIWLVGYGCHTFSVELVFMKVALVLARIVECQNTEAVWLTVGELAFVCTILGRQAAVSMPLAVLIVSFVHKAVHIGVFAAPMSLLQARP